MTCNARKRDFGEAFQLALTAIPNHRTPPRTMTASALSGFSTPIWFSNDKENESPFDQIKTMPTPETPAAHRPCFHWPPGMSPFTLGQAHLQAGHVLPLQALVPLPSKVSQATGALLPVGRDGFRPTLTLGFDHPIDGDVLGSMDPEFRFPIYEDNSVMSGEPLTPLTPSVLNMQDLSLRDLPHRPLPSVPISSIHHVAKQIRASVYVDLSSKWAGSFTELLPNDIIIIFAKGRQVVKIDKYPLCAASRFFKQMLDGPFMLDHTRLIRLRDDFPYAIRAMIEFVDTGIYTFLPMMKIEFPTTTLPDLHIHAYLAGTKYDIPALADLALMQYINFADMTLQMDVGTVLAEDPNVMAIDRGNVPITAGTAIVKSFLESLAFLWKSTPNRHDALRAEVLELLKKYLNSLLRMPFFVTLMQEVVDFGSDLTESLGDDGLEVKTYYTPPGQAGGIWFN